MFFHTNTYRKSLVETWLCQTKSLQSHVKQCSNYNQADSWIFLVLVYGSNWSNESKQYKTQLLLVMQYLSTLFRIAYHYLLTFTNEFENAPFGMPNLLQQCQTTNALKTIMNIFLGLQIKLDPIQKYLRCCPTSQINVNKSK